MDVFSTELEIRLSFIKTLYFFLLVVVVVVGGGVEPPPRYTTVCKPSVEVL
jgi:hypothetical protein